MQPGSEAGEGGSRCSLWKMGLAPCSRDTANLTALPCAAICSHQPNPGETEAWRHSLGKLRHGTFPWGN